MRFIAQKVKFVCVLLTVILSGSLFSGGVFADDEPKAVPAGDGQPRSSARRKQKRQDYRIQPLVKRPRLRSRKRRALAAPLDPLFPGSEYLLRSSAYPTRIPNIR
jgi:hypothetical protein